MHNTHSRNRLYEWLSCGPGGLIADAESRHLERILPDLFGYHLVQVGHLGSRDVLSQSRILNRMVVEIDQAPPPAGYASIRARADALPIESDSVDVVLLPHVLEFELEPHQALREASRIVVPEGHIVVCGFNPISLTGLWRLALRRTGSAPWSGRFVGVNRIKDWFALLGFDILGLDGYFIRPPVRSPRLLSRLDCFERAAHPRLPILGAAYVVHARKRVTTLTPIRPRWRPRRRLAAVGLAGPAARKLPEVVNNRES